MFRSKILYEIDYFTLLVAIGLVTFGVFTIAGAGVNEEVANLWYKQRWFKQIIWALCGFALLTLILCIDYQLLIRFAPAIYVIGIVGLLLCFIPFFVLERKGASSWIHIGPLPQIQPAEFAKLTTILMLARILAAKKEQWYGLIDLMKPLLIGMIPSLLILKQPDLGSAFVFIPITLIMMFVAGMPYAYLLLLCSPALCLLGISHDPLFILIWLALVGSILLVAILHQVPWSITVPFVLISLGAYFIVFEYGQTIWEHAPQHAKLRIEGYMQPDMDPNATNYNINQSKIALGSGGFWGKGLGKGTQSTLKFLPEYQHDFIFPVVGEQSGFIGAVSLLALFLLLLIRGMDTAVEAKTLQGALVAAGIVALFFSHILINVGMVTGLLPVTGLPLTFISYGGSFMLANLMGVALMINVRMRGPHEMLKDSIFISRSQMALPAHIPDDF
ncbi:MAG: rod shape-determining protein RodA [Candidatus Omnitrophota bacterium]|jgi:rod shape determining protein RodA|nr:MAG: rod shape-determining protein RodA [Candidatus Omnitrophota bacterium]